MSDQPGPRQVAENEAARQLVGLAFTVITLAVVIIMNRKMPGGLAEMMSAEHDRADPSGAAQRRMREAQRSAARWDAAAAYLFRVDLVRLAKRAHRRAQRARRALEAEKN